MSVIDAEVEYACCDMLAQHPGLQDVYAEIGQLATLDEDWNDEGALAIDHACILNAKRFVHLLSDAMPGQTSIESAPSVYPTIDGGVQLYWNLRERQVSLTFRPGQDNIRLYRE